MSSKLDMFRCLIALAHADNKVKEPERQMLERHISQIPFTQEEKQTLALDFECAQDPLLFFDRLTNEDDKREVVQIAFALFWSDGEFHEAEQAFFKILRKRLS